MSRAAAMCNCTQSALRKTFSVPCTPPTQTYNNVPQRFFTSSGAPLQQRHSLPMGVRRPIGELAVRGSWSRIGLCRMEHPALKRQQISVLVNGHRNYASSSKEFISEAAPNTVKEPEISVEHSEYGDDEKSHPEPLNFRDGKVAFSHKTTYELWRALILFRACQIKPFIKHCEALLSWSEKILGKNITMFFVRHSFFAHFCAGENENDVKAVVAKLGEAGIGGILDYAAESDVEVADDGKQDKEGVVGAHIYDYAGEKECDANMEIFLKSIDTVSRVPNSFAAIKVTALGKPELLTKISKILLNIRQVFIDMCDDKSKTVNYEQWKLGMERLGIDLNKEESRNLFALFDSDGSGEIDYVEWTESMKLEDMLTRKMFARSGYNKSKLSRSQHFLLLDETDTILFDNMVTRVKKIAEAASAKKVRLMIDAEHTYMQPAIDHFVYDLQREHNREFPVIFNTYQCYLTWSKQHLINDMERAKRQGFYFAGKLVRGAYMVLERKLAKEEGRPSPIFPNIEGTHANYNWCADYVLSKMHRANLIIASQNQNSIEMVTSRMKEYDIPEKNGGVFFGQLLGMSDHISFTLGQRGYQVFKYVPYGPIDEVIPYLVRRIQENSDIMSNVGEEMLFALLLTVSEKYTKRKGVWANGKFVGH
eukprot:Nk52_evm44s1073 gene=Nk52_evmTU44s1073